VRLGIWTDVFDRLPVGEVRDVAAELDDLGCGALWSGEAGGGDALTRAGTLLAATRRVVVATGVASIYARAATTAAAGRRALDEAFPGRFLLGLGVSHPALVGPRFGPPVATMRAYLDVLDADSAVVLGSIGPRMLALAGERTKGAFPLGMPVEHTAAARESLGPGKFLGVAMAAVLDRDRVRGRETARPSVAAFLPNRARSLRALGYPVDHPDDRLVDALVVSGDAERVLARAAEHLAAGADHVALHVLAPDGRTPLPAWRELLAFQPAGTFPAPPDVDQTSKG
jgi:probable F420-dependent oxidoreductase